MSALHAVSVVNVGQRIGIGVSIDILKSAACLRIIGNWH
jgi:hypothetical protein